MKSEIIQLDITGDDIERARDLKHRYQLGLRESTPACPVAVALQRFTGSQWKTLDTSLVLEVATPFRTGLLPLELQALLRHFQATGEMEIGSFAVMLDQAN
jgi:hypothetical protein